MLNKKFQIKKNVLSDALPKKKKCFKDIYDLVKENIKIKF